MIQQLLEMQAEQTGQPIPDVNPWTIILSQTVMAMVLAPLLNGIPTFGEEFGWRAYLQWKLMPLGGRKAVLLTGVIWGVWHWPVIAMGHNYGLGLRRRAVARFPDDGVVLRGRRGVVQLDDRSVRAACGPPSSGMARSTASRRWARSSPKASRIHCWDRCRWA